MVDEPRSASRTARERARSELTSEIKKIARAQLAAGGGPALTVRGIARQMGMASSALFRYFPTRDALLTALIIDAYGELADAVEARDAAVRGGTVLARWTAICHGVRDWAVAHPHEYALIFGSPIPGYAAPQDTVAAASRVPLLLGQLLADIVDENARGAGPETGTGPAEPLPDAVVAALAPVAAMMPPGVPPDLLVRGLMAWTYLFGAVSFEVFGHRHGVVADLDRFFALEVRRIAVALDLTGGRRRADARVGGVGGAPTWESGIPIVEGVP